MNIGLLLTLVLTLGIIVITGLLMRRQTPPAASPNPVVPPVDTTFVGMDTTPYDALRALVDTTELTVDDLDHPVSFERDVTTDDAHFIIDQICRRASSGPSGHQFVRGIIISKDTVPMGVIGNMVRIATVVHTHTQSIRFAAIVQWDGSDVSAPVVRSISFDDLEPNVRHMSFAPADWVSVEQDYAP